MGIHEKKCYMMYRNRPDYKERCVLREEFIFHTMRRIREGSEVVS